MLALTVFLYVCAVFSTATGNSYCSITCGTNAHTMCQYTGKGANCAGASNHKLSSRAKDELLSEHNEFRSQVAEGALHLPKASNMKKMYWNDELESIAQRWADQCTFGHDSCRTLLSKDKVGQNINLWITDSYREHAYELEGWKGEAVHVTPALIDSFGDTGQTVGHFTQMVWADSDRLGCAISVYLDAKMKTNELLVCNYATAGNWLNRPVYKKGEPCSNCLCSKEFEGLCVRADDPDVNGNIALAGGVLVIVAMQLIVLFF